MYLQTEYEANIKDDTALSPDLSIVSIQPSLAARHRCRLASEVEATLVTRYIPDRGSPVRSRGLFLSPTADSNARPLPICET